MSQSCRIGPSSFPLKPRGFAMQVLFPRRSAGRCLLEENDCVLLYLPHHLSSKNKRVLSHLTNVRWTQIRSRDETLVRSKLREEEGEEIVDVFLQLHVLFS